ncbi:hypothetical protein SAMN02745194_03349 [Roseomonas rosea]|uniref:Uncharacterized protein n=1 Tax=Muricoccus roseus TaxID=198092 RepID=A0A1M6M3T7_9PROT|nr:hypothetical protein [Roseomonas rosea]SHJ78149.1 hypothetical protein SAMN02745194_03349 [Roseomonas rosea]
MFESPFIGLLVLALVILGLVVLQRLEFLSVFRRRRAAHTAADRGTAGTREVGPPR